MSSDAGDTFLGLKRGEVRVVVAGEGVGKTFFQDDYQWVPTDAEASTESPGEPQVGGVPDRNSTRAKVGGPSGTCSLCGLIVYSVEHMHCRRDGCPITVKIEW